MSKVSVIIPVYNVEKYLRECLDSVVNQTLSDIEIICINDGSTDNSLEILKEYAEKDDRFIIISQENSGVSVARNTGMEKATGEYIGFVDPDDWLENNALELLYNEIRKQQTDILIFSYFCYCNNTKEKLPNHTTKIIKEVKNLKKIPLNILKELISSCCDKIFKRDFIINNKIQFPENIKIAEDGHFCLQCLLNNASWSVFDDILYNYRINRPNSAMNTTETLIINEIDTLYSFIELDIYKSAPLELKVLGIDKFIGSLLYNYEQNKKTKKVLYLKQLKHFSKEIKERIPNEILKLSSNYKKLLQEISIIKKIFNNIFVLTNEQKINIKRKVLIICGIKLKFNKKIVNE